MVVGCAASSAVFWLPPWLGAYIGFFLGLCPEFLIQDILPDDCQSDREIVVGSFLASLLGLGLALIAGGHPGFRLTFAFTITLGCLKPRCLDFFRYVLSYASQPFRTLLEQA